MNNDWVRVDDLGYWEKYELLLREAIREAFADEVVLSDDLLDKLAAKGVALAKARSLH